MAGIRLMKSKENTIIRNTFPPRRSYGLLLEYSSENSIISNILSENILGIFLYYSHNNILSYNKVTGGAIPSGLAGIALTGATGNEIFRNVVSSCTFWIGAGIFLESSSNNNTIIQNTLECNVYGITLGYLAWEVGFEDQNSENKVYHNNFTENWKQVYGLYSINTWDNGYPSGGNYWSDYCGVDNRNGHYQNMTGSDGIGDAPYSLDENNKDRCPLINPWKPPIPGDTNKDSRVDMRDIALTARAFGSYPDHPRWNQIADINQDNKINMIDIAQIAKNFGKR